MENMSSPAVDCEKTLVKRVSGLKSQHSKSTKLFRRKSYLTCYVKRVARQKACDSYRNVKKVLRKTVCKTSVCKKVCQMRKIMKQISMHSLESREKVYDSPKPDAKMTLLALYYHYGWGHMFAW